ncbi:MAG: DUF4190 domain-containing protein [Candidatus Saccharimonas sp.]
MANSNSSDQPMPGTGLSIIGLVLGVVGLVTFGVTSLVGLGLSIAGRKKLSESGQHGGLALAGIIVSAGCTVVGVLIGTLLTMVLVNTDNRTSDQCHALGVGSHSNVTVLSEKGTLTCSANGSNNFVPKADDKTN